jgi:hypothetical protein
VTDDLISRRTRRVLVLTMFHDDSVIERTLGSRGERLPG